MNMKKNIDPIIPVKSKASKVNLSKKETEDIDFVNNWYNNRKQIIDSKGNKTVLPKMKYSRNINIEKSNEINSTEQAYFDPSTKKIVLNNNYQDVPNVINHEYNHFVQDQMSTEDYNKYIRRPIENTINEKIESKVSDKGSYGNYLIDSNEVHSRLMQYRQNNKYRPEDVITKDLIDQESKKTYMLDMFEDSDLLNLLNNTVDNTKYKNNIEPQIAKYGGTIKKQETMYKKKKYAKGGTALKVPTLNEDMFSSKRMLEEAYIDSQNNPLTQGLDFAGNFLVQNGIGMAAKGIGGKLGESNNGFLKDNAGMFEDIMKAIGSSQLFATGGIASGVPIEAEGDEVIETPSGEVAELEGPSHEQGGIDMEVPNGTEIYSKRVKGPDGKSMADRKLIRERQIAKTEKLLEKDPTNKTLKNTHQRVLSNSQKQEQSDMQKMQFEKMMTDMKESFATGGIAGLQEMFIPKEKFEDGGRAGQSNFVINNRGRKPLNIIDPNNMSPTYGQFQESIYNRFPGTDEFGNIEEIDTTSLENKSYVPLEGRATLGTVNKEYSPDTPKDDVSLLKQFYDGVDITTGDITGLLGQAYATTAQMKNTQLNREGDTPNKNMFEKYGEKGLETMDKSAQYLKDSQDAQLADIELLRNGSISRNRNSSRSINSARALDMATDANTENARTGVNSQYNQAMMAINSQKAGMENSKDQMVMTGEQSRDLADRQDRDNYFSQLAKNISTKGTGIQNIGKNINEMKERSVKGALLNQMQPDFSTNIYTGATQKKITGEINAYPEAYSKIKDNEVRNKIADKKTKGDYTLSNGVFYDKTGQPIDVKTGEPIKTKK